MKPILFNTDMVRTLLEGRKTVTRRVVAVEERTPKQESFFEKKEMKCVERDSI